MLLQREEARTSLTFNALERSLPKEILKSIASDWRSYIRDEGVEFDSAFQKAVRKHLPGIYYVVMAAEFLGKIPFHAALLFFLQPEAHGFNLSSDSENAIFELADFLAQEVRRRAAAQTRQTQSPAVHRADATQLKLPKPAKPVSTAPVIGVERKALVARPSSNPGATRKCAFCRRRFPAFVIW